MAKLVRKKGVDRISALTDEVLTHIMSFLPAKAVVQTSMLSSRWRDVYKQASDIIFEYEGNSLQCSRRDVFLDRILFSRKTDISKLILKGSHTVDSARLNGWLNAAFTYGVKHMDLQIKSFRLSMPQIMCTTLVCLKLDMDNVLLHVPKGFCVPNLKTLHLENMVFQDEDSLQTLMSGCSNLIELILSYCGLDKIKKLSISSNSLTKLELYYTAPDTNTVIAIDAPILRELVYRTTEPAEYQLSILKVRMID